MYDFLQESRKRVFRVDAHPQALKATIKTPTEMELGQTSTFLVYISSGRNKVAEASLSLFPASEDLSLLEVPSLAYTKGTTDDDQNTKETGELTLKNYDAITLPAFGPHETIAITVPYESFAELQEHFLKMTVHYLTPNAKRHAFTLTTSIDTLLPLQVVHSVIWRDQW